jgi:predicted amidohydrolase
MSSSVVKVVSVVAYAVLAVWPVTAAETKGTRNSDRLPRKVIVGTLMQSFWGKYPGLPVRLKQLAGIIDRMAVQSQKRYGRDLDLVILPEVAVTGDSTNRAIPFDGPVKDAFARKAREHHCYIIVPMYLLEDKGGKRFSNAGILIGRWGELVGIYRKLHLSVPFDSDSMEAGATPGKEVPVFECDFGKLGIEICFDVRFENGWQELARKGAELVAWPSQTPKTALPASLAQRYGYYIVSSTWRNNASIFEPTGKTTAQIRPPDNILVQEIDLSYAILPWNPKLRNGETLRRMYGDKVGFRYYEDEDCGIFWSNDPRTAIGQMIRAADVVELDEQVSRIQGIYRKAGVPE